jgi:hypothetical protein
MLKFGYLIGLVLFAVPLFAADTTHLEMGLSLYGNAAESKDTQSRIAGTEIEARFEHTFSEALTSRLSGGFQLETGAARARWAEDFRPRQIARLREAQLLFSPLQRLVFTLGAVDQLRWKSPLLLQRQSFPSLVEAFAFQTGSWQFGLEAEQAVANDTSSLQPFGNWAVGMPAFYLERLSAEYAPHDRFSLGGFVSHFAFDNLSGPSAFQAQFNGNSVTGIGPGTLYQFGFQGFETGFALKALVGRLRSEIGGALLTNTLAPENRNTGWRVYAKAAWRVSPSLSLTPEVELFRAESDLAPAFYNDRVFGHGNRRGFGALLTADWSKAQATLRWVHSSVILTNPYQSDLDWVQFQLSTHYDVF